MFVSETRVKNADFGSSLLLANSPMSPKIVNGSFAAIFDFGDGPASPFNKLLSLQAKDSPGQFSMLFIVCIIRNLNKCLIKFNLVFQYYSNKVFSLFSIMWLHI